MNRGKTIRLFLTNGEPGGVVIAEIINWTGKVLFAPRESLPLLLNRSEIRRPGIYILSGPDQDILGREKVYIGESEDVAGRISEHDSDERKDFFDRVVIAVSKDENLTKGHIRYLEHRLVQIADEAKRVTLENKTSPTQPNLPESDVADLEYFLEQLNIVLPVAGFTFAKPVDQQYVQGKAAAGATANGQATEVQFIYSTKGLTARARVIDGEFVVLSSSEAAIEETTTLGDYNRAIRKKLKEAGNLVLDSVRPDRLVFVSNVPFGSPSTAAAVISASQVSGPIVWKVETTGQTYKDWRAVQNAENLSKSKIETNEGLGA